MTMLIHCSALLAIAFPVAQDTNTIPGPPQSRPIALVGGTIHPVSGQPIEDGMVLFENGKISAVGRDVELPERTREIDVSGHHVYPGLFESHSAMGLTEIASVRATVDHSESGSLNPNVKANVAVNPDSTIIPVTRSNGVLLAVSAPRRGTISGRASVLQLDGWTYEDMTLKADVALQVNWPRMQPVFRAPGDESPEEQNEERDDALAALRKIFRDARTYAKARAAGKQKFDVRLESMQPVVNGTIPLLVRADALNQIQSAVAFAAEQNVRLMILGGYDAPLCAELLKQHDVPVIVSAAHRRPRRRSDDYDAPYTLALRLHQAGITYCISGVDRSETTNARNLPYEAAQAVAFGLPRDEAIRAITLYPARIFGVENRVGSLEAGKDATIFVCTGDPLETPTQVTHAWIQGRTVDLNDKHKSLYRKYSEKYRQLKKKR